MILRLTTKTATEFLYLPYQESELNKALERLGVAELRDADIHTEEHSIPDSIYKIMDRGDGYIGRFNDFCAKLQNIGSREFAHLSNLVEFTEITEHEELHALLDCWQEFEMYPDVRTAEEYGKYMICESGRFEYDENLADYINFASYGEHRISQETGAFTDKGYIVYHGYNKEMEKILAQTIGIDSKEVAEPQTLKLYMPLTVTTYYEEDMYGDFQYNDFEGTLDSRELYGYECELNKFINDYEPEMATGRELMEHYDIPDTVNSKVKRYHFAFEQVDGNMYGVAVAELNAPLNANELQIFKDTITGQAADGLGESIEQCDFDLGGRDVNIHLWSSESDWAIKTAKEMGFSEQPHKSKNNHER